MEKWREFYKEKATKARNFLLEGPKLVLLEEEKKQEREISFSFYSDTRRYYFGNKEGKPFFMVEYFDSLPDELSETERKKFTKEKRRLGKTEKTVYVLKYGEVPEQKEEIKEPEPNKSKKYRVAQSRDFERKMINDFVTNNLNKQILSEILARYSKLSPEEIAQITEQTFEAYGRGDPKAIRIISNRLAKKVTEMVRNEIRESMLPKPQEIKISQLVNVLKNKRILFYTGAGISMAGGVYGMDQLEKALGIDMSQKIDSLLKKAIINPKSVIDLWEKFIKAAFEKPATPAHQSLGRLAQKLKAQIFTENIDHLQERAGVRAVHLTGPWLKENVKPEWLKDVDVVITIGLSYDDRGFLGWYKENNPKGKIIAINLSQPSYLGNEDFVLKGDCQKIIPKLEKEFAANK